MSKEKLIEEMARTVYKNCDVSLKDAKIIAEVLISKGYRKQSEWVSVDERLPPKYEKVLVFSAGVIEVSRLSSTGLWWEIYDSNLVTHWTPLPEAPKMKGDSDK